MTAAYPVDTVVNPNNSAQRYTIWGNGRVDASGGATPLQLKNAVDGAWYDRTDQPVILALIVLDWTSGASYGFDYQGGFNAYNGAPDITTTDSSTGIISNSNGLPYQNGRYYMDVVVDPAGTGMGYALTSWGELVPFFGAPACPRTGPRFASPVARRLVMQWTPSKKALTLDCYGNLYADFTMSLAGVTSALTPGWDAWRDIQVTDWNAPTGYTLDLFGGVHTFSTGAITQLASGPYQLAEVARTLNVISASNPTELYQVWVNGEQFDYFNSTAPTVVAGNGVSEIQTVTISGTPTGGTFSLTYNGPGATQTASGIAFSASAGTVQTALQALTSIGAGGVIVTGGPGPGTPYVLTFAGPLAVTNVNPMTAAGSFTGGTSPTIAVGVVTDGVTASPANIVTTTTRPTLSWSYSDAQKDKQAQWQVYLYTSTVAAANAPSIDNDPSLFASQAVAYGTDTTPQIRGVVAAVDLANGGYKYYVRVQDTSGLWSPWVSRSWTQNVAIPATPTNLTATADQVKRTVNLKCSPPTGGNANLVQFQCSDDGGKTWNPVRGADAVALITTTTAVDYDPPMGIARQYRAYCYATAPRVASAATNVAIVTLTKPTFVLTAVNDSTLGGEINVVDKPTWTRASVAGVFQGIGAVYPTVVSDGVPKARKQTLVIDCNSRADWNLINNLVLANSTLVLRDPFGEVVYCRVVGDWTREQQRRGPDASENTSLRHAHKVSLPLVEIAQPVSTAALSTVPPGPAG